MHTPTLTSTVTPIAFTSNRLTFSPFTQEDYQNLKTLHQHPEIAKMSFTGYSDDARVRDELITYMEQFEQFGISNLAVREKETGAFIGRIGVEHRRCDPARGKEFELRIAILPEFWGKGYAPEGSRAVLYYALNTLRLPRVVVGHKSDNLKSAKIIKALGFTYLHEIIGPYGLQPYYEMYRFQM